MEVSSYRLDCWSDSSRCHLCIFLSTWHRGIILCSSFLGVSEKSKETLVFSLPRTTAAMKNSRNSPRISPAFLPCIWIRTAENFVDFFVFRYALFSSERPMLPHTVAPFVNPIESSCVHMNAFIFIHLYRK